MEELKIREWRNEIETKKEKQNVNETHFFYESSNTINKSFARFTKEYENIVGKTICTSMFTAISLTIVKNCNQFKCLSIGEWIKRLWYAALLLIKKDEALFLG